MDRGPPPTALQTPRYFHKRNGLTSLLSPHARKLNWVTSPFAGMTTNDAEMTRLNDAGVTILNDPGVTILNGPPRDSRLQ
jgi:hypothetical protein